MLTVNPSTYFAFQNGLEVLFYYISFLSCCVWGNKRNCHKEVVQSTAALNTVLVKKIMWYLSFSFPIMNHPHYCHLYFEVLYFRFSSGEESVGLGSNVSEKYTACVFRRLSEVGGIIFIKNSIHTRCFGACVGVHKFSAFQIEMS